MDLDIERTLRSFAIADIDGDGDLDLAAAAPLDARVLLNPGNGAFSGPGAALAIGSNPVAIALARIDADEHLDIVTANDPSSEIASGSVSVLLNDGGEGFRAPRNTAVGIGPVSVVCGDLDGDADADVMTADAGSNRLSVLLGRGDGTLAQGPRILLPGPPISLALADLDAEGDLDAASGVSEGPLSIFLNHGDATFAEATEPPARGSASLLVADFTGDTSLEIAVAYPGITLLQRVSGPNDGDCNGNEVPDGCEVDANDCNGNRVPDDCDLASGSSLDCNRNGRPDECDARPTGLHLETMLAPSTRGDLRALRMVDLDGDGFVDIAGLNHRSRADYSAPVSVLWNHGGGLDTSEDVSGGSSGTHFDPADFDADADLDLVLSRQWHGRVDIVEQVSRRRFQARTVFERIEGQPGPAVAGDLDGDGDIDVAFADSIDGTLFVQRNQGDGTFEEANSVSLDACGPALLLADFDGDGRNDIVTADWTSSWLVVLWNSGAGFEDRTLVVGMRVERAGAADLDRDGDLDIAQAGRYSGLSVGFQDGPRRFQSAPVRGLQFMRDVPLTEDLNGDGMPDLAAMFGERGRAKLGVFFNGGGGSFDASFGDLPLRASFSALTGGDFDGDGAADLAASVLAACDGPCVFEATVAVFLNRTVPPTSLDLDRNGRPDECDPGGFRRGDADGDGTLSIADAVFTLRALFQGGPAPGCAEAADADNDGAVGLADPVSVLEFLFRGGPPPAAPGPPPGPCGLDTDAPGSPAHLGCAAYEGC
jgi:hypothetical protein